MKRWAVLLLVLCVLVVPAAGCDDAPSLAISTASSVSFASVSMESIPSSQAESMVAKQEVLEDEEMVWIPKTGSKYHHNAKCSGMKEPILKSRSEAENLGYNPCKNCY